MSKSTKDEKKANEQVSLGRMVKLMARFVGGQKHMFSLAGLMLVFEAATAALIPLLAAYVVLYLTRRVQQIEGVPIDPPQSPLGLIGLPSIINPDVDTIAIITLGIVVLTMINSLGDSMAEIYLAKGGRSVGYNLRVSLYAHLQKLSLAFHDQRRTGDILTRVTSDVAAIEDFIISSLSDFVGSVLLIFFMLIAMVVNAWQVALVAAFIIPVMALVSNYFTQRIKAASKKRRTSEGELASAAQEMLASIRVIQTYGLGSYEQALFANQSQKAMDAALEAAAYQARFSWVVSVLGAISVAMVIWMAVWLIFRSPVSLVSIALLTTYTKYIQDMFKPTKRIIQEWNTFGKLYASVERIGDLLDLKPSVQDEPGATIAPRFEGRIEFRNVNFSYPSLKSADGSDVKPRTALKNLNFSIEPGQVVAVVGHTGAGKSTIAQLLPRLYDPTDGEILIDGHNIKEFTLESLRAQTSMVLQEAILFSGSVVENIGYGRPDASGAEIIAAAKQANAHEFIEKLPEGYYTMLGERGSNLSGGQRQRLSIARAFIRNTSILIMDEPTTGLDAESTELVLRALRKLMKGKTTIIISHDLNLIRDADKIIVIKAGEIEQMGTHEELIREGGLYANLYMMQSGQTEISAEIKQIRGAMQRQAGGVPVPATGLISSRLSDRLNYDLPNSEHFRTALPEIADAFDAKLMKDLLQENLFDPLSRQEITACKPGKAIYMGENLFSMQYDLKIKDAETEQIWGAVVNARVFTTIDGANAYLRDTLMPMWKQAVNRPEFQIFKNPVAVIEQVNMAVSVFPIDGLIPTLVSATDRGRMINIFNETLPEALSGNFIIKDLQLELAHYGRYQRCVLRYLVEGVQEDTRTLYSQRVYGKVDADGYGGLTVPVLSALRESMHNSTTRYPFRIPLSFGYLPDLKMLMMEALPGEPVIKRLLRERMNPNGNGKHDDVTLEEAIEIAARIAASLHQSGVRLGRRYTLEKEVEEVQSEIRIVQRIFPELAMQFQEWLDQAVELSMTCPTLPMVFSHGDFRYTQLVFDGPHGGLVDFDTVCQAEPSLDLGQFIAYQRLSIDKDQEEGSTFSKEAADQLCEVFLNAYLQASEGQFIDEVALRTRVSVYEIISLIRLAVHSWQKLKGGRLYYAIRILEERIACLTQVGS